MRRSTHSDAAVQDIVGTVLLVAVAVALASVLAVSVTTTLTRTTASPASIALTSPNAGDAQVTALLRNGEAIPLNDLRVYLARNASTPQPIPSSQWTTPTAAQWRAGDSLSFPLSPAAAPGERLRVTIVRPSANALVGDVTAQAAGAGATLGPASLVTTLTPSNIPADALTATRIEVRVTHPLGALAIASVIADVHNVTNSSGSAVSFLDLNDRGVGGDVRGGDGIWTALLVAPTSTTPGVYNLTINATDVAGARAGTTVATLNVATGPITLTVGARTSIVPSANITQLVLRNWTWNQLAPAQLSGDHFIVQAFGGGHTWTADVELDYTGGSALAKTLTFTSDTASTVYVPRNTSLPLAGLAMDLLNPTTSLQWKFSTGDADPLARYQNASVSGSSFLSVAAFVDKSGAPGSTAIYSTDVIMR